MRQRALAYVGFAVVLVAICLAYRPGLAGTFLFDDFANLPSLGATGPTDNGPALARYLTSGVNDPLGRPITIASFLIDAHDWPADPYPFKRTNLLIHLLNTVLLAGLLLVLGRRAKLEEFHARNAAVLGAALWALHPLFVSTTLYIVQREAMLPVSFTLIGLLLWLAGQQKISRGEISAGVSLELVGLGLGTLLATLSKANGALLPLYALLIEHLLLRPNDAQPLPRAHRIVMWLLWLPAAAVIAYLLHTASIFLGGPAPFLRDWTLDQRLLTEPRILFEYLRLLWLPHPFTNGLFNDQVQAAKSWLQPWTTLPSVLGIIGLIAAAWLLRRRIPLWSLAILFFFTGHLVESSVIPLELYFEHRNYLPAMLMFWPLAIVLLAPGQTQRARIALALVLACGLGLMTHASARIWGNPAEQTLLWAKLNPGSPRAQANAAQMMVERGHPEWAQAQLRPLLEQVPNQIQITFNLLGADCKLGGIPPSDLEAARQALSTTHLLASLGFQWLGDAIEQAKSGNCPGLTLAAVQSLLDAAWNNPAVQNAAGWKQDILNLHGKLALAQQQPLLAYQHFATGLLMHPTPATALEQAATLGTAGQQKLAVCELELWEQQPINPDSAGLSMVRLHNWILQRQNYWPNEVSHLKKALRSDMPTGQRDMPCPALERLPEASTTPHAN